MSPPLTSVNQMLCFSISHCFSIGWVAARHGGCSSLLYAPGFNLSLPMHIPISVDKYDDRSTYWKKFYPGLRKNKFQTSVIFASAPCRHSSRRKRREVRTRSRRHTPIQPQAACSGLGQQCWCHTYSAGSGTVHSADGVVHASAYGWGESEGAVCVAAEWW